MIRWFKEHIVLLSLVIILVAGFYLRAAGIFTNSFAFTYDVGRDLLEVQKIVQQHKTPLIGQTTGLGGLYYGPWWYYILTPTFLLTGGNPQGIALFMVFVGELTILFAYILGKKISSSRLGLILASLVALSPVMIGYSAQIWNPNLAPLLVVFTLLILLKVTNKKNNKLMFVLGFLLGLILDTEIVFGVLFIISAIFSYIFLSKKVSWSTSHLWVITGFLLTLVPRIVFELRHEFIMTNTLIHPKENAEAVISFSRVFIEIPNRAMVLFRQYAETTAGANLLFALVLLILTIITGSILSRKDKRFKFLIMCCVIILIFFVGASIFARAIWGHYIVGLPIFYLLSLSIALDTFWKAKTKVYALLLFILICLFAINPFAQYKALVVPLWEGNAAVYRNQLSTLDYVYHKAGGKPFNEVVYTPSVHDFPYQYLFSWYGGNKYGYEPSKKTEKLFFVIIEPDPDNEQRIKDWLSIREKDGRIIDEVTVKGGIRVQTRVR